MNIVGTGVIITILLFTGFWGISEYNKYEYEQKIKFANDCRERGKQPKILDSYGDLNGILYCDDK